MYSTSGPIFVRRKIGKEFNPQCTIQTSKYGRKSIMIWGCMRHAGVGLISQIKGLMDAKMYVSILHGTFIPFCRNHLPLDFIFQQDNDPKHNSKLAKNWFEENAFTVIKWPPYSPDLNPIEHFVIECWDKILNKYCVNLVDSMPRCCREVIKRKGYPTNIFYFIAFISILNVYCRWN